MRTCVNTKLSGTTLGKRKYSRREMLATSGLSLAAALNMPSMGRAAETSPASGGSPPPNIIVVLSDSFRADHLGCLGYAKNITPRIDAMAESSFVFEHCYSQAPWTKPSIASLFSGYVPPVHQAVLTSLDIPALQNWDADPSGHHEVQLLRDEFNVLADSLKALGYTTALFQTNPHCQQQFGFARGFDHYRYVLAEPNAFQFNEVLAWMHKRPKEPFFMFIHVMDPHGPYTPTPKRYKELFGCFPEDKANLLSPRDIEILTSFRLRYEPDDASFKMKEMLELSDEARAYLISLYDAEIFGVDYCLGRLLDYLDVTHRDENTIVVFTSDHGEAFGEHDFYTHNNSLYEEELHVPLIIRGINNRAGVRVPWNVGLFSLFPTIVSLAGGEPSPDMQAKTFLTRDDGLLINEHRSVCAYFDHNKPDLDAWEFCLIQDDYKVIDNGPDAPPEIYCRADDPTEQRNLFGEIDASDAIIEKAKALRAKHKDLSETHGEPEYGDSDAATMEGLRALGYL